MNGIPDPGRAANAVRMVVGEQLVAEGPDGVATTTSLVIAEGTGTEHRAVLQLIRTHLDDFEEFGGVASEMRPFQTAGGMQRREVYILNEDHAALLMTYMRNSAVVRDFKKRLVREFARLRRAEVGQRPIPQTYADALRELANEVDARELVEARNAELEPKAEFYDELMDADGSYSMQAAANIIGWGRNVMMRELRRRGVLQGNNLPYRRYAHHFKVVPGTRTHPHTGDLIPTATTHVLPSGIPFIRRKLAGALELAVTE